MSAFSRLWDKNVTLHIVVLDPATLFLFRRMLPGKRKTEKQVWLSRGLKAGMTHKPRIYAGSHVPGDFRAFLALMEGRSARRLDHLNRTDS